MRLAIFILVALFVSCPLCAFEIRSIDEISPTAYRKWDLAHGPIRIAINSNGSDDLPFSVVESRTQRVLRQWESVSSVSLYLQYTGATSRSAAAVGDTLNSISWIEKSWPYSESVLAVSRYTYVLAETPYMIEADIVFNGNDYKWSVDLSENYPRVDYEHVLLHELGHVLGLSHSSVFQAALFPYLPPQVTRSISRDDKAGIAFLYSASSPHLALVNPIKRARYVKNMASNGYPLPVFRWHQAASDGEVVVEISKSRSFSRKISFVVTGRNYYAITPANETRLLKIARGKRLFWRVRTGSTTTSIRSFRFKPLS